MASYLSSSLYRYAIDFLLARAISPYVDGDYKLDSGASAENSGELALKNVLIKKDIIEREFNDVPFTIEEGLIGKISLKLPAITNLLYGVEPIQIDIIDVVIVVSAQEYLGMNADFERKRALAIEEKKDKLLTAIENQFQRDRGEAQKSGWFSSFSSSFDKHKNAFVQHYGERLQLNCKNIHIRALIDKKYAAGIRIGDLVLRNTNEHWNPNLEDRKSASVKDSFKLLEMKDLSVYWHNFDRADESFLKRNGWGWLKVFWIVISSFFENS